MWGLSADKKDWTLLYQLPLGVLGGRAETFTARSGNWLSAGGPYVTVGSGKFAAYDAAPITHIGFSVTAVSLALPPPPPPAPPQPPPVPVKVSAAPPAAVPLRRLLLVAIAAVLTPFVVTT